MFGGDTRLRHNFLLCPAPRSLGAVLGGWTVNVIEVSNAAAASRAAAAAKTMVGFIAEDGGDVVPSEEVTT